MTGKIKTRSKEVGFEFDLTDFVLRPEDIKFPDLHSQVMSDAINKVAALNEQTAEQALILKQHERIAELETALKNIRDCLSDGDTCNIETAADIANNAIGGGE